ncbi:hypothetical protein SUGI_0815050 [Cryptomeria japonica]|uniref:uncharacterized protein LOC131048329 n=1 Tax=Cryptomeria japonica TaxID=3369 RepID=UPI002414974A|nr:uncharacterized protein LOC131048329 [Cryptomeria japonica]GLJ39859.1 hypothetical protein SUGI_0815050 [Cryptomeria japonica]
METTNVKKEEISIGRSLNSPFLAAGRVGADGKISRKRSRVSKRIPTTVLNTDTSNFKAMVQHFTGAPFTNSSIFPNPRQGLEGFNFYMPNKSMASDQNKFASSFNVARPPSAPFDIPPQSDIGSSFINFLHERPLNSEELQNYMTDVTTGSMWDDVLRSDYPSASPLSTHFS